MRALNAAGAKLAPAGSLLITMLSSGCAHPSTPRPAWEHDPWLYVSPLAFDGPPCVEGGPSVQIVGHQEGSCGKHECLLVDQRIRNPTDRPVWLVFDASTDFSAYLDNIGLDRPYDGSPFVVWRFQGQNYHQVLRLLPGTDVIVRGIVYFQYEYSPSLVLSAFVDSISIASEPSPWPHDPGFLPTHGEFAAEGLNGLVDRYVPGESGPLYARARVSIHTLCVQRTEVPP